MYLNTKLFLASSYLKIDCVCLDLRFNKFNQWSMVEKGLSGRQGFSTTLLSIFKLKKVFITFDIRKKIKFREVFHISS